jgi:predicted O-methyltransferase YrrM
MISANDILTHASYLPSHAKAKEIAASVPTFHHHFHILLPIMELVKAQYYLEIGSYQGASASLASQCSTLEHCVAIDSCDMVPNQEAVLRQNFTRFNKRNVSFHLLKMKSQDKSMVRHLYQGTAGGMSALPPAPFVDVLFLDGESTQESIVKDFKLYYELVRPGGIIVIDDYSDNVFCPGVKSGVDQAVQWAIQMNSYWKPNVIGCLPNQCSAFENGCPALKITSNCFIIQKSNYLPCLVALSPRHPDAPLFGIVMATYRRQKGTTPHKIAKALESIKQQCWGLWRLYLVGDCYSNENEFRNLIKKSGIPMDKVVSVNLPIACERDYVKDPLQRWQVAGATAMNTALQLCRHTGIKHACHLDDDDTWEPQHLQTLVNMFMSKLDPAFVNTRSKYVGDVLLPRETGPVSLPPRKENITHSSLAWRLDKIPFFYGTGYTINEPADGNMLERIRTHCQSRRYNTCYASDVTVLHLEENVK